jgi:hypothetical protein
MTIKEFLENENHFLEFFGGSTFMVSGFLEKA